MMSEKLVVSVPFHVHVYVDVADEDGLTLEMVMDAIIEQHGKYPSVDVREAYEFEILGTEEI